MHSGIDGIWHLGSSFNLSISFKRKIFKLPSYFKCSNTLKIVFPGSPSPTHASACCLPSCSYPGHWHAACAGGPKWAKCHLSEEIGQNLQKTKNSLGLVQSLLCACGESQILWFVVLVFNSGKRTGHPGLQPLYAHVWMTGHMELEKRLAWAPAPVWRKTGCASQSQLPMLQETVWRSEAKRKGLS